MKDKPNFSVKRSES